MSVKRVRSDRQLHPMLSGQQLPLLWRSLPPPRPCCLPSFRFGPEVMRPDVISLSDNLLILTTGESFHIYLGPARYTRGFFTTCCVAPLWVLLLLLLLLLYQGDKTQRLHRYSFIDNIIQHLGMMFNLQSLSLFHSIYLSCYLCVSVSLSVPHSLVRS